MYVHPGEKLESGFELNSIAFIPDGNRRYAEKMGISYLSAYRMGTQRAWDVLDWILKYPSIKAGTFYTLSAENLNRNRAELMLLFRVFERELDSIKEKTVFEANSVRLKFIGDLSAFPKRLREKMLWAEHMTADFGQRVVNLALGYSGREEIVNAAKSLAIDYAHGSVADLKQVDEEKFRSYLYSDFPDPDLIVRTSGTQRLSGFLTYQSAYSELYFIDKCWPELEERDIAAAVSEFSQRQR